MPASQQPYENPREVKICQTSQLSYTSITMITNVDLFLPGYAALEDEWVHHTTACYRVASELAADAHFFLRECVAEYVLILGLIKPRRPTQISSFSRDTSKKISRPVVWQRPKALLHFVVGGIEKQTTLVQKCCEVFLCQRSERPLISALEECATIHQLQHCAKAITRIFGQI